MSRLVFLAFLLVGLHGGLGRARAGSVDEQWQDWDTLAKTVQGWSRVSTAPSPLELRECRPVETAFGEPPLRILATLRTGALDRIDVLLLGAPATPQEGARFTAEYQRLRQALPERVSQQIKQPFTTAPAAAGSPAGSESFVWTLPGAALRLMFEPGRRVSMSLRPTRVVPTADLLRARVKRLPNGDVVISPLPVVDPERQEPDAVRGVYEVLQKYHGWTMDYLELCKRTAATKTQREPFMFAQGRELARAVGARQQLLAGFDLAVVKREIDNGRIVLVDRGHEDHRLTFFEEFALRYKADPAAELPAADEKAERAKWVWPDTASYSTFFIVHGYNPKRGEIIFSHPDWGEEDQNLRMRVEEMQISATEMLLFSEK